MRNYKNTSFNTAVLLYGVLKLFVLYKYFVIAVRVSGGHLCEAEAPTEPAGETSVRCAAIRFSIFKRIKSSCARAARAPYFCTDRNRGKNRRTPFQLGFRTFPNDQRDKLPFGNLYCTKIRYVPINSISGKSLRYPVIARGFSPVAIRFLLKGNTDSFVLRVQYDKQFSCRAQFTTGKSKFSKPLLSFSALFCPLPCGNVYCGIYCG